MSESQWYLYIIECANGPLYTGVTLNIDRRFCEHESGGAKAAKFLRGKGPFKLVYQELVGDRSAALKRELEIKSWSRKKKLALISF